MVNRPQIQFDFVHADLGYGTHKVLSDINLSIEGGSVTCLIGPNGAGKTTLFKSILGFLPPISGKIQLNGKSIARFSSKELARYIAYVPQAHSTPFPYKVIDVVLFGRSAHLGYFNAPGRKDRMIAESNLDLLEIRHLAERSFSELSGGEQQLVIIARALTQETSFLIFDEPTSNLDYGNQIRVIQKIKSLRNQSIGILMATHSPDHAFMLSSQIIILDKGLAQIGNPDQTLTAATLIQTYGVEVQIFDTPNGLSPARKICVPVIQ